jgi:outer membrane beta-barrel protein
MTGRRRFGLLLFCALLGLAGPAAADEDPDDNGPRVAIQNRKHALRHELTAAVGTIPIDAYYKGLTGTVQYTFHFNDNWAWEVVSFSYSRNFWTSLRTDLENNWRSPTSPEIPEMQYFGDTNLVWKPLYGKLAYLNRSLVYGELFLTAGAAAANYSVKSKPFIGGDVGLGFRVHLSERVSARLDLRYYRFAELRVGHHDPTGWGSDDVLFVQLGLSVNLH